ncbi:MAG: hypothetical protein C4293_03605 [Nitrospiraceae bacterium]
MAEYYKSSQKWEPLRYPSLNTSRGVSPLDLTDEPWDILQPLVPSLARRPDGNGRPCQDDRAIRNGILWIWRTGAPRHDLPDRYPPYQRWPRRFQPWGRSGAMATLLRALADALRLRGGLDLTACFIDGPFVTAKRGPRGERPSGGTGRRSWQWQTVLVCRSPYPSRVLRRLKAPWSNRPGLPEL